jgi:hypothetical protein
MTGNGLASHGGRDAAVGETLIEETAAEIRSYAAATMLTFADTVGRIVLERFYDGDEARWHSHGAKDVSLRRLAERLGDAHLSASSLHRCIGVHCVLARLGDREQWRHLTPTHVRTVLPLPEPDQERLLRDAESMTWSVRELEVAVRSTLKRPARGRPPAPPVERALRLIESCLAPDGLAFAEAVRAQDLDVAALSDIHARIVRAQERLDRLRLAYSPKVAAARTSLPLRRRAELPLPRTVRFGG